MITEIGIVAGEIWHYLEKNTEVILSDMVANLSRPRDLLLMSIGWLAREGHIILKESSGDYKILLRK